MKAFPSSQMRDLYFPNIRKASSIFLPDDTYSSVYGRIFLQGYSAKNHDGFTEKALPVHTANWYSVWTVPFSVCILSVGRYGRKHNVFTQNGYDGTCPYWLRFWIYLL